MLKPAMSQIIKPGDNYYEFVVAVARKAREIASEAEEKHIPLEGKPVTLAVEMFAAGQEKVNSSDGSANHNANE